MSLPANTALKIAYFAVFSYLLYFQAPKHPEYHWIAKKMDYFFTSHKMFKIANKSALSPTSKRTSKLWYHFQLVRNYFAIQLMWGVVRQLIKIALLDLKPLEELDLAFVFQERFRVVISVEFCFAYTFEILVFKAGLLPVLKNVSRHAKIKRAVKVYTDFMSHQKTNLEVAASGGGGLSFGAKKLHFWKLFTIG